MEAETIYNDVHCLNLKKLQWNEYTKYNGIILDFISSNPLSLSPDMPIRPPSLERKCSSLEGRVRQRVMKSNKYGLIISSQNFNDLWLLDFSFKKLEWKDLTSLVKGQPPAPRHGHTAVLLKKSIFIFGGRGKNSKEIFNDMYCFDIKNMTW